MTELFTIGHSNHSIETFIQLLRLHKVTALADVRSHPYSRYLPHFNQAELKPALFNAGIRYVFLGRELGARPSDPSCYIDGKAVYEKIAATKLFAEGIQRILKGLEDYKIALMCAEKDPITCHRAILVCQYLPKDNFKINHILKTGDLETHNALEERLLNLHNFKQPEIPETVQLSLFNNLLVEGKTTSKYSQEESLKEAYRRQGSLIAYVEKKEGQYEQAN
ncbi:DUF488 domain-containing protein [Brasilonema sp. UFV-L1]|uniref:DUF488 domain-containing protein n=1 Tax=Brasilonema sp. UFV-L1 TaxID=2234130 RepID=UPI00145EA275|nr:DUF488 domain-containing protein [Brasilonema sp. UFV-L1]NMG08189.1 hypothetical protein [Brasilonema sp. UFV-L1]